uniref:Uncharacterized protein n=1 Tax=Arundo donax TaxID=35708 RepID=A0A0A9F9C7_ARUDO
MFLYHFKIQSQKSSGFCIDFYTQAPFLLLPHLTVQKEG